MVTFKLYIYDIKRLPEVKKAMKNCRVQYNLLQNRWMDEKKTTCMCEIQVRTKGEAVRLRRAIGCISLNAEEDEYALKDKYAAGQYIRGIDGIEGKSGAPCVSVSTSNIVYAIQDAYPDTPIESYGWIF